MKSRLFGMVHTAAAANYTQYALESFFRYTPLSPNDQFLLLDNDSCFELSNLQSLNAPVHLVQHSAPQSFAANINLALRTAAESRADLYFLNNDIIFTPKWVEPLAVGLKALLTPVCNMQLNYSSGDLHCKLSMELDDYLGHESDLLAIVEQHHATKRGYRLTHSVPYYCIKIPHSVYSEVGQFNEEYHPAGFEDTDYTLRCYLKGIPIYFAVDSFILHFYGKSTWSIDGEPKRILPPEEQPGRKLFEKKWGKELTELFAIQSPAAMTRLRKWEDQAITAMLGQVIAQLRSKDTFP